MLNEKNDNNMFFSVRHPVRESSGFSSASTTTGAKDLPPKEKEIRSEKFYQSVKRIGKRYKKAFETLSK